MTIPHDNMILNEGNKVSILVKTDAVKKVTEMFTI
jgi:Trk K+ transport system NAD-binding subunit